MKMGTEFMNTFCVTYTHGKFKDTELITKLRKYC